MSVEGRMNVLYILVDDMPPAALPAAMRDVVNRLTTSGGQDLTALGYGDTALCGPARVGIHTGKYTHNHGATDNATAYSTFRERGYARADVFSRCRRAGYNVGFFGKFLNGYGEFGDRGQWVHPGVDEWITLTGGQGPGPWKANVNGIVEDGSGRHTPYFAKQAEDYIMEGAGLDTPWFCYLALTDPHTPHTPGPFHEHSHDAESYTSPGTEETDISDKSTWTRDRARTDTEASDAADWQRNWEGTLEEVESIAAWCHRLLDALEASGQTADTAIFFASDNGYMHGEHGGLFKKLLPYEESVRVPFLVRIPGVAVPADLLVSRLDITATILDVAQAGYHPDSIDGRSFLDAGRPEDRRRRRRQRLLVEQPSAGWYMLREGDYALITFVAEEEEFYNLRNDPYELESLDDDPDMQQTIEAMGERLARLRGAAGNLLRQIEEE